LFGRAARPALDTLLDVDGGRLLVALDCDGTLAPMVARPDDARVPAATLRSIARCPALPGVTVAIVSARIPSELRALIPLPGVRLVGLYGLTDRSIPAATRDRWRRRVRNLERTAAAAFEGIRGARLEPKGLALAAHDRGVRDPREARRFARALRLVRTEAKRLGLEATGGRRVVEFIPRGEGKDTAVLRLIRSTKAHRAVYFGDSAADDPVHVLFRRRDLGLTGLGVHVGMGATRAAYRVRALADVRRFLDLLRRTRAGRAGRAA
jgi:trehalose 6-phosphate phosphatase